MYRVFWLVAGAFIGGLVTMFAMISDVVDAQDAERAAASTHSTQFYVDGNEHDRVYFESLGALAVRVTSGSWDGVGVVNGDKYLGVFRYSDWVDPPAFRGVWGVHRGTKRDDDGSYVVHGENVIGLSGSFDLEWRTRPGAVEKAGPSVCPNGWRYTGAVDARCLLENVPLPAAPKSVGPYCDYVKDGYGGFSWNTDEDGAYQCPSSLRRSGNGAGASFCIFDVPDLAKAWKLEPACDVKNGVLGVKLTSQ